MAVYENILDLVGNTPLLRIKSFNNNQVYAKLEMNNPGGSIKDRVAKSIILKAIEEGKLTKSGYVVEATSGNTGIGLCAISNALGYKCIITMPSNMSEERIRIFSAYQCELVLTNAELGMKGAIDEAKKIVQNNPGSFFANQFENYNNVISHVQTGKEIYEDMEDVDYVIASIGTGGTITGVGKYLKEKNKNIKIIGVEPIDSPILSKGISGSHKIQGIGANFIPKILDTKMIDEIICASNENVKAMIDKIAKVDGILVGISAGAALFAAEVLEKNEKNKKIVVIIPDGGFKYLSTDFYKSSK